MLLSAAVSALKVLIHVQQLSISVDISACTNAGHLCAVYSLKTSLLSSQHFDFIHRIIYQRYSEHLIFSLKVIHEKNYMVYRARPIDWWADIGFD